MFDEMLKRNNFEFTGAGQEVGKSCVVVTINGKRIMFDCGMHMGHSDHQRYPDFSLISESGDFDNALSCIIITHLYVNFVTSPYHMFSVNPFTPCWMVVTYSLHPDTF